MKSILLLAVTLLTVNFAFSQQNVGIGTTTPSSALHIKSAISNNPFIIDGTASSYYSILENGIARGYWGSFAGNPEDVDFGTYSGATGKLHLTIQAVPKLTINNAGNVGIGTTNPTLGKLQIEGAAGENFIYTRVGTSGSGLALFVPISNPSIGFNLMYSSGYKFIGDGFSGLFQYNQTSGDLHYYSSNASGLSGGTASLTGSFFTLDAAGRVGIGTSTPTSKLHVNGNMVIGAGSINPATGYSLSVDGKIIAEEIKVQLSTGWPDYVFSSNYKLMPIEELENSINKNKHLPNIPSAADITADKGFELGEMNRKLLEKVEELTLYIIQLKKENNSMETRLNKIEKKLDGQQ